MFRRTYWKEVEAVQTKILEKHREYFRREMSRIRGRRFAQGEDDIKKDISSTKVKKARHRLPTIDDEEIIRILVASKKGRRRHVCEKFARICIANKRFSLIEL